MRGTDVVVVGGGIVGLSTAYNLLESRADLTVLVLEKERRPAVHQSGRNSGVLHSGVYYAPGSLKARTVAAGRRAMIDFCSTNDIPLRITGKVIVAVDEHERPRLRAMKARADENGIRADLVGPAGLADLEPAAAGVEALHVPGAGAVDFAQVCRTLARLVHDGRGEVRCGRRVRSIGERAHSVTVATDQEDIEARVAVNCAGLHSDLVVSGTGPTSGAMRIVPFRGEYRRVVDHRRHLVRSMIYPVPDPRFPFLGVHFTRAVDGEVHAGPNAVLALAREGYSWSTIDPIELFRLVQYPGFRRLAARQWRVGLEEVHRSVSASAFVGALQRLVPAIDAEDLEPAPAGVRAQAVDRSGALVDDFVVRRSMRTVHVLNAPSPAATASLEIGRMVAGQVLELF